MLPLRDDISTSRKPFINLALIAINVGVFVYEWTLPQDALRLLLGTWGTVPAAFNPGAGLGPLSISEYPTFITGLFLHGGLWHLLGNMLFLWTFGDNVEDRLGHARYLFFYLTCGIAASVAQVASDVSSPIPIIGASGAIGGVMGAYMISYPRARVLTVFWFFFFVRLIWIPAVVYLGVWFAFQLLSAARSSQAGGGVAVWAHVGGFVAGVVLVLIMKPLKPLKPGSRGSAELAEIHRPNIDEPGAIPIEDRRSRGLRSSSGRG